MFHATATTLEKLGRVQSIFLREVGLNELEALEKYNLAPLGVRRDVALLGVVHRTVLGKGPPQFRRWFYPAEPVKHSYPTRYQNTKAKHGKQLHDYLDSNQTAFLRRSPLGLPRVYNELPAETVAYNTVKKIQSALQGLVLQTALAGNTEWQKSLRVKEVLW